MPDLQCHALVKKTGHRCKNVAATDGYCILHSKAFATATVAELPPIGTGAHETIEAIDVYDAANPDAGLDRYDGEGNFIGHVEYDAAAPNVHEVKDADGAVTGVFVSELKGPTGDVFVAPFGTKPEDFPEGWIEVGATDQGWKVGELGLVVDTDGKAVSLSAEQEKLMAAETKGFAGLKARSQPTPRCTIKSCHKVRGHGGKHENGSRSIATCAAKSCRLPLNHSGEHGQPARERVRIGELTGKL